MSFTPEQKLSCGCVVSTVVRTGEVAFSDTCATIRPALRTMANSEGGAAKKAGDQMRAHAKANGQR